MTKAEWIECTDPQQLLKSLRSWISDRKLRLFCCVCSRSLYDFADDWRLRNAVKTAEAFADGKVSVVDLLSVNRDCRVTLDSEAFAYDTETPVDLVSVNRDFHATLYHYQAVHADGYLWSDRYWREPACLATHDDAWDSAYSMSFHLTCGQVPERRRETHALQCAFLRDLVGNPFRPAFVDPVWRTGNVLALAQAIYTERAHDRLPILADALEEAGCTDPDILNHCRQPGVHVRGCWVIDLLSGKE